MARFEEALQGFWLRDLHRISGRPSASLKTWLTRREYLITGTQLRSEFFLQILNEREFLSAVAFDSSRMSCAAIESVLGIRQVAMLPRSTGWLVIQMYYAAFFAAHALLRMFGTFCLQLEGNTVAALDRVANALGSLPALGFEKGFYVAKYNAQNKMLSFRKSTAASRGSHEVLWEAFVEKLREMSKSLLLTTAAYTAFAVKLGELESIICEGGHNTGGWLSHIRNLVNYRHEYGAWFPYQEAVGTTKSLFDIVDKWKADPLKVAMQPGSTDHLRLHLGACVFIVNLCRLVSLDMSSKCPKGRSFHSYGCAALMSQAKALKG
jgi:hypothetical protein